MQPKNLLLILKFQPKLPKILPFKTVQTTLQRFYDTCCRRFLFLHMACRVDKDKRIRSQTLISSIFCVCKIKIFRKVASKLTIKKENMSNMSKTEWNTWSDQKLPMAAAGTQLEAQQ